MGKDQLEFKVDREPGFAVDIFEPEDHVKLRFPSLHTVTVTNRDGALLIAGTTNGRRTGHCRSYRQTDDFDCSSTRRILRWSFL